MNLIEAFSWRVLTEVCRIRPSLLRLVEWHPGGGQSDCLSLFIAPAQEVVRWNRGGILRPCSTLSGRSLDMKRMDRGIPIPENGEAKDLRDAVCRAIDLPIPNRLPSSTPRVLAYRLASTWLESTVFRPEKSECRSGFNDTSGHGGGVSDDFKKFPRTEKFLRTGRRERDSLEPAYDFWFLRKAGEPRLCLYTGGMVWNRKGAAFELPSLYKKSGNLWPVLLRIAPDLFD